MIGFATVQTYMLEIARRQITPGVVKFFANWPTCCVRLVPIGACGSLCGRGLACFMTHFLTIPTPWSRPSICEACCPQRCVDCCPWPVWVSCRLPPKSCVILQPGSVIILAACIYYYGTIGKQVPYPLRMLYG